MLIVQSQKRIHGYNLENTNIFQDLVCDLITYTENMKQEIILYIDIQ